MNIVMIGPFGLRPKGTMAVRALPLASALSERGHRVCLILPPWSYPQDSGRTLSVGRVQVANIPLPPRLPGLWHAVIAWRLVRAALAQQPDVVHCFKPKGHSGLAALLLWLVKRLRLARLRLVVDSDDWEGRGGWNEIERYSRVQKAFFAWQEKWGLTHADAVTLASRTLQSIVWSLGVAPQRTFYVPNGSGSVLAADVSNDLPRPLEHPMADGAGQALADGAGQALQQGRLSSHSTAQTVLLYTRFFEFSIARVVKIVEGILHAVPGARLVVVGAGLFGEERQFLQQMTTGGLVDRVQYAGWRAQSDLPGYFAAADVAIYPFDDTLINRAKCAVKLTDLLAAGVPVVADRVGQNAEYIEHGVSGLLVDPGDDAAFVASVVRLLGDADLRRSVGTHARRRMADVFSWALLALTAEDAYKQI